MAQSYLFVCLLFTNPSAQLYEKSIQALTMHITWRVRNLSADDGKGPEFESACNNLAEQRDSLLEKLTEFVGGAQSNVSDGVKRVVRIF